MFQEAMLTMAELAEAGIVLGSYSNHVSRAGKMQVVSEMPQWQGEDAEDPGPGTDVLPSQGESGVRVLQDPTMAMVCQPSARLGVGKPAYSLSQLVRFMLLPLSLQRSDGLTAAV